MSLAAGINTLAAVSVTGVKLSYTLTQLRGGVNKPTLPALLPLPGTGKNTRAAYAYETESFDQVHTVRHRLLVAPEETSINGQAQALLVELIDNYLEALNTLEETAGADDITVTRYESGIVTWGGVRYHGCDFFVELAVNEATD